jgi:Tol biopolymer transport system component
MKTRHTQTLNSTLLIPLMVFVLTSAVAPAEAQEVKNAPTRIVKISAKEVTDADISVSPYGSWLVFTLLGHLFQLPAAGGSAKQLTFGPFYDEAPAISPDGKEVAFVSDRKVSSQGNAFVLELASGKIREVTDEASCRWCLPLAARASIFWRWEVGLLHW